MGDGGGGLSFKVEIYSLSYAVNLLDDSGVEFPIWLWCKNLARDTRYLSDKSHGDCLRHILCKESEEIGLGFTSELEAICSMCIEL